MSHKNIEIRQLKPGQINDLARILDEHNGWKKLMSCITSNSPENGKEDFKYNTEDIRLIEQAGERGSCTEILMSEWGTSGKERPTVRVLLEFLYKAELIRAAEYVSEKILKEPSSLKTSKNTLSEILKPESIDSPTPISALSTVECNDIKKQFNVEESHSLQEQFSQEEIENMNVINYDAVKTCTKNFDSSMILGNGGFGTVYFGLLDGKNVAIKQLNIYDKDSNLLGQFKNELMMLSRCSMHPNILPLVAVSLDKIPCLVYEFMPNGSLDKRLACQLKGFPPMSWKKRIFVATDISNGLNYLHTAFEAPFIHRDIKSANILLNSEDVAKIGDFGLVRKHKGFMTSNTLVYQGTQAYTAPEAFHGTISVKMDIFSFGVVLLELLTGLPAYSSDREGGESLVDYIEEVVDKLEDFENLLDKEAGSWNTYVWTEIYHLYKKCTAYKKIERPEVREVHSMMTLLKEKVQ